MMCGTIYRLKQSGLAALITIAMTWPISGHNRLVINEIHYNPDVKTEPVKFVELYNADTNSVDLSGWFFSSGIGYTFPSGTVLASNSYLVIAQNPVFLKKKYGASALGPFTGNLSTSGDNIVLRDTNNEVVNEVDYKLGFPWPTVGDAPGYSIELINPGLDNNLAGSWRASTNRGPTPGRQNSIFAAYAPPQIRQVDHHPASPTSNQEVKITAKTTDPDGVAAVTLLYQLVEPGNYIELTDAAYRTNWMSLPMNDDGMNGDATAGDHVFTVVLPASMQLHRRLVRYRITAVDSIGVRITVPYPDDPQPNFAYFVYDGVPAWTGSVRPGVNPPVTFDTNVMRSLPVYHLISKKNSVERATWLERYTGTLYKWSGTLVYDGQVYDHIHYRARGGVWRYSMVKNMWKFDFNRGHDFEARDNFGQKYDFGWRKLNLGACIQQGDYGHRGEQGLFEAVGFKLFNLAGVAACRTHWIQFRIIDDAQEANPASQFDGDFWGLYLAVEQMDGRFLDEHQLPDGNLYKMEGGTGTLNNQGPTAVTNKSDLNLFISTYSGNPSDTWWRTNFNLAGYYDFQAIVQAIHHYDVGAGKNYFYYLNPETKLWSIHPWDLDLTWADNMYDAGGQGADPFKNRVLPRPAFKVEYGNRIREIRDLLFNTNQAWQLIDEYAAIIHDPSGGPSLTDADRAQWDYNPKMKDAAYSDSLNKAGQGRFYQFPQEPTVPKNFNGAIQLMKNYVVKRAQLLDSLVPDSSLPATPSIQSVNTNDFPVNRLTFRCSPFIGLGGVFSAMQWRVGEITPTNQPAFVYGAPRHYEITAVWESGELASFNETMTLPPNALKVGHVYRIRARLKDNTGRWSHWSAPIEFTAGEPDQVLDLANYLRLSELMPNPAGGSEYEYIELRNISTHTTLGLAGMTFTKGIGFTFSSGTTITPGSYLLVVKASPSNNFAGFRVYYGLEANIPIVGPYTGSLANEGERITLKSAAAGQDLIDFTYGNGPGWPLSADGAGYSLVPLGQAQIAPQNQGSLNNATNWQASFYSGGSPGRAEPMAVNPIVIQALLGPPINGLLELNVSGNAGARYILQASTNLVNWIPIYTNTAPNGTASFFDTQTTNHTARFYRVLEWH